MHEQVAGAYVRTTGPALIGSPQYAVSKSHGERLTIGRHLQVRRTPRPAWRRTLGYGHGQSCGKRTVHMKTGISRKQPLWVDPEKDPRPRSNDTTLLPPSRVDRNMVTDSPLGAPPHPGHQLNPKPYLRLVG